MDEPYAPSDVILPTLVIALVGGVLFAVHNYFFHPLASFPGPTLAAMTPWWRAYIELHGKENFTTRLWDLHARYGPIVRVSPNELHFSDPAAYHEIYNMKNRWDKDSKLYNALRTEGPASFHLTKYAEAKRRRDAMIPLFSRSSILNMQHLLQENMDTLCNILTARNSAGQSSDILLALRAFALDTITSFCFAKSVNALHAPDFKAPLAHAMTGSLPLEPVFKYTPLQWVLNHLPPRLICLVKPDLKAFFRFQQTVADQVAEAMRNRDALATASHPTVYQALLDESNKHTPLTAGQLRDEAYLLTFAGTDTASNTMTVGIVHVLANAQVYKRLKQELREAWPDLSVRPRYEALEKLPYLRAVVKESLRVGHGVLSPMDRIVPARGAVISGQAIPGGAVVGISNIFVHLSPSIFPDLYTFRPERWIEADGPDTNSLDQWLVAFHRGPRSCLGINLAQCELYLAFANLFRRFDLSLQGVGPRDMVWKEYYLPHYHGPSLQVRTEPVAS